MNNLVGALVFAVLLAGPHLASAECAWVLWTKVYPISEEGRL